MTLFAWMLVAEAVAGKRKRPPDEVVPPAHDTAPADARVFLPCEWAPGTTFTYTARHLTEGASDDVMAGVAAVSTESYTVEAPTSKTTVAVRSRDLRYEGAADAVARANAARPLPVPPDLALRLALDDGQAGALLNHAEAADAWEAAMRPAMGALPAEVQDRTFAMLRDPALGSHLLTADIRSFLAMHCVALEPGQTLRLPISVANPTGGAPLPGTGEVTLVSVDAAAKTLTFVTHDAVDPAAMQGATAALVARMAPPDASPEVLEQLRATIPPMDAATDAEFVMSASDGFPIRIESRTMLEAQGVRRVSTWTWTRLP
jgi:hypothetical protein